VAGVAEAVAVVEEQGKFLNIFDNGTFMVYDGSMDTQSSSTIKINLPEGLLSNSTQEARRIGISVQDFMRLLLATYFSRSESITALSRDKMLLDSARKEIAKGYYTEIKSPAHLRKHLLSL